MSRVTRAEWYRRVNAAWPENVPGRFEPGRAIDADEAVSAARRLYRFATGQTWKGPVHVASGNRAAFWFRRVAIDGSPSFIVQTTDEMTVNPEQGWRNLVHYLSHWAVPGRHGADHARMELRLVKEVVRRGWLDGRLRKAPPEAAPTADEARGARLARLEARRAAWDAKARRAARAIAKLDRQIRGLRRAATRAQGAATAPAEARP